MRAGPALPVGPRHTDQIRHGSGTAASFAPDLPVLSGDLAEHGAPEEYAVARDLLASVPCPVLAIPGNHDDCDGFRTGLGGLPNLIPLTGSGPLHTISDGPVRIIGFDVTTFAGRPALTAPALSTSLALRFVAGAKPASFTEPSAMLLHLWRDGRLVTRLQAVGDFPGPHPFF